VACNLSKERPYLKEVTVGGKHFFVVSEAELSTAYTLLCRQPPSSHTNIGGFSVRSLYIPNHGFNGVLYRVNEHAYVNISNPLVIKISKIFSLHISGDHHVFLKGYLFNQLGLHLQSGNPTVIITDTEIMVKGTDIIRKVMLFPIEDINANSFVVIDYGRESFPLTPEDIIIPQCPEPDDMVSVNGDNGETWLAHIQHTNCTLKVCQVYFYVPDRDNNKLYRKESHRLDQVHWNAVLGLIPGIWLHYGSQFLLHNSIP